MKSNADEDIKLLRILAGILTGVAFICLLMMCSGCTTTKYVTVPEYHTDTLYKSKVQVDSIHVHDSVTIHEKGDTVLIERWHTKWRDRLRVDTVMEMRIDSIPYPIKVPVEVPATLTWWQQTKMHIGGGVLWILLIFAVVYIGKRHIKKLTS